MIVSKRLEWSEYIHGLQDELCRIFEEEDGKTKFHEDRWQRKEGGGGKTRVLANGHVFEKAGINTSEVYGKVTDKMRNALGINGYEWYACGLSLVMHPKNPFVPTVHANYRMFELFNEDGLIVDQWFGGGADLTPYYLNEQQAIHFHQTMKDACDPYNPELYPKYKEECDNYFVNWHRNEERRGIGGIFYDHLRQSESDFDCIGFAKSCGDAFALAYLPIVQESKQKPYDDIHRKWQLNRRSRYVEFNLIHDRGTLFGLKTNGRTESILMSLPPIVHFLYDYQPTDEEQKLIDVCLKPKNWVK